MAGFAAGKASKFFFRKTRRWATSDWHLPLSLCSLRKRGFSRARCCDESAFSRVSTGGEGEEASKRERKRRARDCEALFLLRTGPAEFFFVSEGGSTTLKNVTTSKEQLDCLLFFLSPCSSSVLLAAGPRRPPVSMENPQGDANAPGEGEHASVSEKDERGAVGADVKRDAIDRVPLSLCSPTPSFFFCSLQRACLQLRAVRLSPSDGTEAT